MVFYLNPLRGEINLKVYISVDIEGVTGVTNWDETILGNSEHEWARKQMTDETIAACEAAIEMGATDIIVKDAHDSARNIDITRLPREVRLLRGWTEGPESMMSGIDETFDASIFIGYHSGAGYNGNPLSHTMHLDKAVYIKINDELVSEFTINSYISAYYKVPVVFLSGDEMLCKQTKSLIPAIETVGVKKGIGDATLNMNPKYACESIKIGVKKGLEKIDACKLDTLKNSTLEIRFREHKDAYKAKYYPGASVVDDLSVRYEVKDIIELVTTMMFIL